MAGYDALIYTEPMGLRAQTSLFENKCIKLLFSSSCFLSVTDSIFINSQTLGQPQAMPPALHVKQRLTRLPALEFYSSTTLSVKSHCFDMSATHTRVHIHRTCWQTDTQKYPGK